MKTYCIGRDERQDIVLNEPTVSRKHMELVVTQSGKYYVTDCGSSHGTRVAVNSEWKEVTQGFIEVGDTLLVGRHQVTMTEISALIKDFESGRAGNSDEELPEDDRPIGDVERDPITGEPVLKH